MEPQPTVNWAKPTNPQPQPPQIILVLGCPGAGKGTLCKRLSAEFNWYHLSVGDYLRELCANRTTWDSATYGRLSLTDLEDTMQKQQLIPAEKISAIVAYKIEQERKGGKTRFLVDGYPRQIEAAALLDRDVAKPMAVFLAQCPKEIAKARFLARKRGQDDEALFEQRYIEFFSKSLEIQNRYLELLRGVSHNHLRI